MISVEQHLETVPASVRPIVDAARRAVRAAGPKAREVAYQSAPPKNPSTMWKLARYSDDLGWVVGLGVFTHHANLYFYRGRELDPSGATLSGRGAEKRSLQLRSPDDANRPEVKRLLAEAFELGGGA